MIVFLERFIPRDPKPCQGVSHKIRSNLTADLDLLLAGQQPFTPLQFLQRKVQQQPPRLLRGFQQVTVCISLFVATWYQSAFQSLLSPDSQFFWHVSSLPILQLDQEEWSAQYCHLRVQTSPINTSRDGWQGIQLFLQQPTPRQSTATIWNRTAPTGRSIS